MLLGCSDLLAWKCYSFANTETEIRKKNQNAIVITQGYPKFMLCTSQCVSS